ncbi:MAG TPA: Obg family GTPase CgtA, partial [Solirubrobacteraceae bacterium]|nr:Obg family GTPase CgtA [Solirubrobacteraceae bacterium]
PAQAGGVGAMAGESSTRVPGGQAGVPGWQAGEGGGGGEELVEYMVFRPAAGKGFMVERTGPRAFAVRGKGIERLLQRYDIENEDAMAYLEERLRRIGVMGALEAEGFEPGDELEVGGVTFELDPEAPR